MKYIPKKLEVPKHLTVCRVAAYCRVSTQQEIQLHSLEAQHRFFEKQISRRKNWILVGIYADQASGKNNQKMPEFQRLMKDCRTGKIDIVLIKSISRMGRNTLQFLIACGELHALGVDLCFDVEHLSTSDPKLYQMLTIFAGLYQNEIEEKSAAIRWTNQVKFASGSSGYINRQCYGYRLDENGQLVPDQVEAAIVRMIFRWHEQGCSLREISQRLHNAAIPTPRGKETWGIESLRKLLNNEKYTGDVLLQKTYVADFFTGRQKENHGELTQYLIHGNHEAILKTNNIQLSHS